MIPPRSEPSIEDGVAHHTAHHIAAGQGQMISRELSLGEWRDDADCVDYRVERLSDLLIERATWAATASPQQIGQDVIAGPGFIWFRFWLLRSAQVVEKYFRDGGETVGIHIPICTPFADDDHGLRATRLTLALWLAGDGQLTVLNETEFERDTASGLLTSEQAVMAEERIRTATAEIAKGAFPPTIIRNFELHLGQQE